jgi:hypothetical protein
MTKKYTPDEALKAIERIQYTFSRLHSHILEMTSSEPDVEYLDQSYDWMEEFMTEFARNDGEPIVALRLKGTEYTFEFTFGASIYPRDKVDESDGME